MNWRKLVFPASFKLFLSICLLFSPRPNAWCQASVNASVNDTTYLLTYDHGGQILWGLSHFQERLNNAKEWLDKYPEFKIGLENEAHVYDYFAESNPALLEQIKEMLQKYKGRFGIGSCSYGQPLMTFINEESNIRQLLYAIQTNEQYFNYRPPVYLMSEHAMHSQLPQILKSLGYQGAIMRTHFMMYGYNPTFNVAIGNWKGIDGSKIATIPTYTGEGAAFGKTSIDNWILTRYPSPEASTSLQEFRKQFGHIHPLLASRADDAGLRKEELVKEIHTQPKFEWILLDDLLSKYPEPPVDMPTAPNDFSVRMPWGYCGNYIWNESRKAEVQVLTAERLAGMEFLFNGKNFEPALTDSWKNLLVGQHHDIQIVGLLSSAKKYLSASIEKSKAVEDSALRFFATQMKGTGVSQVTVFNPLSWTQSKWITININEAEKGSTNSFKVENGGKELPVRLVHLNYYSDKSILDGELLFKAELPPLSISSFSIIPQKEKEKEKKFSAISVDQSRLIISTPFTDLQLAPDGGIKSWEDKSSHHTFSSTTHPIAYFAATINGIPAQSKGQWIIEQFDSASPSVTATEYGMIADIPYRFELKLFEDRPQIECKATFDFNGQKIGLLSNDLRDSHSPFVHDQKLRFKFFPGLDEKQTKGIRDLPFVISETTNQNVEGNYWTALSDGKNGIAFFNKGNMGSIREADGSFSVPLAYAMYYIWGTRMLNGSQSYEFALYPFSGDWHKADVHREAIAYNFPVPYVESKPGNGKSGSYLNLFEGEFNDIILSAFYIQHNKPIVRFYEYKGQNGKQSFKLKNTHRSLSQINMEGTFIEKSQTTIPFRAWEIKTFEIK